MPVKLSTGHTFPAVTVARLGGGDLALGRPGEGRDWQLVVVYRGKHCPICAKYLKQLTSLAPRIHALGIDVVAVSADPEEKAAEFAEELGLTVPVGYGLDVEQMQALGLYVSGPRGQETEGLFAEPAVFVVDGDGVLRIVDVSNVPFARPDLEALTNGLKFVRENADYPIRGTHAA